MELILNAVWVLVAAIALACWFLLRPRAAGVNRGLAAQILALGVLLLVLFPAISITDDLWAVRNPAETDILVRRHDHTGHELGVVHASPAFLSRAFQAPDASVWSYEALHIQELPFDRAPARAAAFIRPPPAL